MIARRPRSEGATGSRAFAVAPVSGSTPLPSIVPPISANLRADRVSNRQWSAA